MKLYASLIAGFCLAFLVGCDTKATPGISPSDVSVTKPSSTLTTDVKAAPQTPQKTDTPTPPAKPTIDRGKLPKSLLTDAYYYFGLNMEKPLNVQIKNSKDDSVSTGAESIRLTDVNGDVATFEQSSTGSLSDQVGTENVELRKDGVYLVHSDKITVDKPQLALPIGLKAGKSWSVNTSMEVNSSHINQKVTYVCKGEVSVKSGGKDYKAFLIYGSGTFTGLAGKKAESVTDQQWFVKNVGLIKEIETIMQTGKGQKPVTVTMELQPESSGGKK